MRTRQAAAVFGAALMIAVIAGSGAMAGSVSAAKSRVAQAKEMLASGRTDDVEPTLKAAEKFLDGLTDEEKAPILADIKALRAKAAGEMKPEDQRKISAAKGKVKQALSQIESGQTSGIEDTLNAAEGFLDDVADAHKAEVLEEIKAARGKMRAAGAKPAGKTPGKATGAKAPARASGAKAAGKAGGEKMPAKAGGGKPATDAAPAAEAKGADAAPAELSEEDSARVSKARSRVTQAKGMVESGRTDDLEETLAAAEKALDGLSEEAQAPILADIRALRAKTAGEMKPEDERKVSAALGKVKQAGSEIESGRPRSVIEGTLDAAEGYVDDVPDAHKAEVLAEIAAVRRQLGGAKPAGVPGADGEPGEAPAAMSAEDEAKLAKARSRVRQATELYQSKRMENVEAALEEAESLVEGIGEEDKARIVAEIAQLRDLTSRAGMSEKQRSIADELDRHLDAAGSELDRIEFSEDAIQRAASRLAEEDTKEHLSVEQIKRFEARLDAARTTLAANIKAGLLNDVDGAFKRIDEAMGEDPFKGKDDREAYTTHNTLEGLMETIQGSLEKLPADDADAKERRELLAAAQQKMAKASAAWGKAIVDEQVGNSWSTIKQAIAGWEQETEKDPGPLEVPQLPKTGTAVQRIGYFLNDAGTKKIREENKGDATLEKTYVEAEKTLAAAAAKLNAAFARVLAEGEKMPTPMRRFELDRPSSLAVSAEYALAGTKYMEPVIARARKLDEKWKAEVAAIMRGREELYKKLSAEADAKWPAIVKSLRPQETFDASSRGKTVLLKGVYNRIGWDFGGREYSFAMRFNGTPVAGVYEPHVLKALEHAWYELKLDVNDRIEWDVIAVVEGPGKVGEKTIISLIDKDTSLEIGKLEEYRPVDCVRVKIIALHAGPVAVGPEK